jgi:hypothetical protein
MAECSRIVQLLRPGSTRDRAFFMSDLGMFRAARLYEVDRHRLSGEEAGS